MRGLIPAHIMARIEKLTGLQMADMVDIFCGPSTGAILNAALNVPSPDDPTRAKYKAKHMVRFYEQEGLKIFPPDRFRAFRGFVHDFNNRTMKIGQLNALFEHGHYDRTYLDKSMQILLGETKLSDSVRSLIVPVYNIDGQLRAARDEGEDESAPVHTKNNFVDGGGHAVWLKNMAGLENDFTPLDVSLRDCVLGSTAAPTYFPCHDFEVGHWQNLASPISAIDGSIFDNPCISYHGAIRQHLHENDRLIMILLGTGHTHRSFKKDDWNRYGGLGVVDPTNDLPLINILFHASETALVDSFKAELGDDLFVFNKSMITCEGEDHCPTTQIDDASPEQIKRLRAFSRMTIEDNQVEFDRLLDVLVRNYEDKKSYTPAPAEPNKPSWWPF